MSIRWDAGGSAEATLDDFEGSREITKLWVKDSFEGREFLDKFYTTASTDKLREQLEFHGLPISFNNLTFVYSILRDSGQLTAPKVAALPDVPRGRDGHPLTSSQLEWRNFAIWANDPKTSSRDIAEKRRTSPSFQKFYVESLKREMEHEIDGAVTPSTGEMRPTSVRGRL